MKANSILATVVEGLAVALSPRESRRERMLLKELVDLSVVLADRGEAIADVTALRDQPDLFG